jgi:hypothetical protein
MCLRCFGKDGRSRRQLSSAGVLHTAPAAPAAYLCILLQHGASQASLKMQCAFVLPLVSIYVVLPKGSSVCVVAYCTPRLAALPLTSWFDGNILLTLPACTLLHTHSLLLPTPPSTKHLPSELHTWLHTQIMHLGLHNGLHTGIHTQTSHPNFTPKRHAGLHTCSNPPPTAYRLTLGRASGASTQQ